MMSLSPLTIHKAAQVHCECALDGLTSRPLAIHEFAAVSTLTVFETMSLGIIEGHDQLTPQTELA